MLNLFAHSSLSKPSLNFRFNCLRRRHSFEHRNPFSTTQFSNLSDNESRLLCCLLSHRLQDAGKLLDETAHRDSHRRIVHWTSIITRLSKCGFFHEAKTLFDIIPEKNIVTYNAVLTGYIRSGELSQAWRFFQEMPRNVVSWTLMLCGLSDAGRIHEAKKLFDEMPDRNTVSWNSMVVGLIRNGDLEEARRVFDAMPSRSVESYNVMISGYVENHLMDEARSLFEEMKDRNVITWTSMVSGYCRVGDVEEAFQFFRKMPERNVVSWTAMIGGFAWNRFYQDALLLFHEMNRHSCMSPESETLTSLCYACAGANFPRLGKQIHARVIINCHELDERLAQSLIQMYASFGLMGYVQILFDNTRLSVQSWNCMINSYLNIGCLELAQRFFEAMPTRDIISWTVMIEGYLDAGQVSKAFDLFRSMPESDAILWTTMISGLIGNELFSEAANLFSEMQILGIRPLNSTYSALFGAAGATADLLMGKQLHCLALKSMSQFDAILENSLISMYAKSGEIRDAYRIFSSMTRKDSFSWNSMIIGFSHHGLAEKALMLFKEMLASGTQPDSITFLGALSACANSGLVDRGLEVFNVMKEVYAIEPGLEHCVSVVNLLCRAGRVKEVEDFISALPMMPNRTVWGALLGTLGKDDVPAAAAVVERAAERLLEVDPQNGPGYVALCNWYARRGRFGKEGEVRREMRAKGVRKVPGCSWVVVDGRVCVFFSGG